MVMGSLFKEMELRTVQAVRIISKRLGQAKKKKMGSAFAGMTKEKMWDAN
jgi:hypothetical protein